MRKLAVCVTLALALGTSLNASAQEVPHYLSPLDSLFFVVPNIPLEELEAELDAVSTLLAGYERAKRDADFQRKAVSDRIKAIEKEIDVTKAREKVADEQEDEAKEDSLKAVRDSLDAVKDYFKRAEEVREAEKEHAEALVSWTKRQRESYEKALELMRERQRPDVRTRDLLVLEREYLDDQDAAADRMKRVADRYGDIAKERKKMYDDRSDLRKEFGPED